MTEGGLRAAAQPDSQPHIRLHEQALFRRAYPKSRSEAREADAILLRFGECIGALEETGADLTPFTEPEVSGIAGTAFSAVFSFEAIRRLLGMDSRGFQITSDAWDTGSAGAVLRRIVAVMEEDWPVEANVPYREWMEAAAGGANPLAWLIGSVDRLPVAPRERAELYDSLRVPVSWTLGESQWTRSRLRLGGGKLFYHRDPLLRRSDVSLQRELDSGTIPVRHVARAEARRILDVIVAASATRYRELYGFNHPDENRVWHAEAGRGLEVYLFGVPPEWRLPVRAYHSGMYFKNGVPTGYIEVLSLAERAEVGFNLYYTFREGESAWIYARLLALLRQMLGVTCFSVDPYQIGYENHEAVESGAFWFYRKLGFRPLEPDVVKLVAREEQRIATKPGYRSSRRTLERLARGYILFEAAGSKSGDWDRFRVRNLGLAAARTAASRFGGDAAKMQRWAERQVTAAGVECAGNLAMVLSLIPDLSRWSAVEKAGLAAIVRAKAGADETQYLRLMQNHSRLRRELVKLGSGDPPPATLSRG